VSDNRERNANQRGITAIRNGSGRHL